MTTPSSEPGACAGDMAHRAAAAPAGDRVLVAVNPFAGRGHRENAIRELLACLEAVRLVPQVIEDLSRLETAAAQLHASGSLRAVVVAGGDGTVAAVANRTSGDVPLAVFPLGTANLLARHFGMRADPVALAHTILQGATRKIDAACANGRLFVLMVGCGLDAEVVQRLHLRRTAAGISYWTYARPILESILSYRYPRLRVYCETDTPAGITRWRIQARWAFVLNLPCYAGGLQLAPDAVADDGLLDVCTFRNGSLWHGLWYLGHVRFGRASLTRDHRATTAQRVWIEAREPVPYQLDGDPGGVLPLKIETLPGRITLMCPTAT